MTLHHWYHVYSAGNWAQPVTEHCKALTEYGLYDELDTLNVGFVGTDSEIAAVISTLDVLVPKWQECARAATGWEQVTLNPLYDFVQDHDGQVSYAHTKGSSRNDPVDVPWRRMMTYHNIVNWRNPVEALEAGKTIAGCYWVQGAPSSVDGFGHSGMFGGNYFWTKAELLRRNVRPGMESRYAAEHWLGQLSEVIPLTAETIHDMQPLPIGDHPPPW